MRLRGTFWKRVCVHAVAVAAAGLASTPATLLGQKPETGSSAVGGGGRAAPPSLQAHRVAGSPPVIDGFLDEADWAAATVADGFIVFEPNEGEEPTQVTEARVLYGDEALFVGIRAFDTSPDSIVAQLARRDDRPHSDWVDVVIDSYHDRRTAFRFGVNPAGVKSDGYLYDDVNEDDSWDAVWEVATSRDRGGWTAEFRIPYSQLRFDGAAHQIWGINFARFVARHLERSLWAPISRGDGALVSRFGDLEGLRDLSPPARVELVPYSLARLQASPGAAADPFYDPSDFSSTLGADVKYGITTDLTLDITINPDFGQVEADPAQVNLTAFETFFPEKRPFFMEGLNIFSFRFMEGGGDMASEGLFYSRRIGRTPQGRVSGAQYSSAPQRTRILGAAKLSGKTRSGWSLGFLHALTGNETARRVAATGPLDDQVVEPGAQYGMARATRDFRNGKSAVGVISTWTARDGAAAEALSLHSRAYTFGADARHRFGDDRFVVSGYLLGSALQGSAAAIARTQRSPARYFQRPDAEHTRFDPALTSLNGWAGSATFAKISGGYWRFATGALARSPGFDSNDLGFMREADLAVPFVWVGYQHYQPSEHLQRWSLDANAWTPYSFGGEPYQKGVNVSGNATFNNFWSGYAGVLWETGGLGSAALRGGPMLRSDPAWSGWFGISSDSRKTLQFRLGNNWAVTSETDSWRYGADASVLWRPSTQATVSAGPFLNRQSEATQWVGRFDLASPAYLFGRIEQTTAGITVRGDWTFSPTLSLQVYAQPFVSAGRYGEFKRVDDPRADEYERRFLPVQVGDANGRVTADIDGDGAVESFHNPDFNFKQLRSNVVLRWEYTPGSTLFAVWSQGRNHFASDGTFSFGSDLGTLLDQQGDNVFMLKLSYWIG